MVLALPMDHLVTISGALSVRSVRQLQLPMCVHVITSVVINHNHLVVTTTANQAIQVKIGKIKYIWMTSYGMESSVVVRAHAALVPTLHHGSVWILATQQVISDIEVRIMGSEGTANEDTPIELHEIYVQQAKERTKQKKRTEH